MKVACNSLLVKLGNAQIVTLSTRFVSLMLILAGCI